MFDNQEFQEPSVQYHLIDLITVLIGKSNNLTAQQAQVFMAEIQKLEKLNERDSEIIKRALINMIQTIIASLPRNMACQHLFNMAMKFIY